MAVVLCSGPLVVPQFRSALRQRENTSGPILMEMMEIVFVSTSRLTDTALSTGPMELSEPNFHHLRVPYLRHLVLLKAELVGVTSSSSNLWRLGSVAPFPVHS